MIIFPKKFVKFFNNIIEYVKLHNNTEGGIYKLFTMSLINLALYSDDNKNIGTIDNIINNIADLGFKTDIPLDIIEKADILDWSGVYKPWYINGLYRQFWEKYNLLFNSNELMTQDKNTIESWSVNN